jgi:hypothetical protein
MKINEDLIDDAMIEMDITYSEQSVYVIRGFL